MYKQLLIVKRSNNFKNATRIVEQPIPSSVTSDTKVLIKNLFAGLQASDIMISNGAYGPLRYQNPPVGSGAEAIGQVMEIGSKVTKVKKGDIVLFTNFGCGFTEYTEQEERILLKIKDAKPEYLSIIISGVTALLALEENGKLGHAREQGKKTVLVTAAAGATGLFAVQIAKLYGHHVIGTTSDDEKSAFLKSVGVDRVVNYKKEKLDDVLKQEYKKGIDVIYESVGGEMFQTCLKHLAENGILIVIGMITNYTKADQSQNTYTVPLNASNLLFRAQTITGFFLVSFAQRYGHKVRFAVERLIQWYESNQIKIPVYQKSTFLGLESIYEAIDTLHSGQNIGKVYITLPNQQIASKL